MAKRIASAPEGLLPVGVVDIHSVSDCISHDFTDYIDFWMHNNFCFFDSLELIKDICSASDIDDSDLRFFYYRVHEFQFDNNTKLWQAYELDLGSNVVLPDELIQQGYDVVTYSMQNKAECSPLSCNSLAAQISVNRLCLISSLDDAISHLENGKFDYSEPGPFRIIEVNEIGA